MKFHSLSSITFLACLLLALSTGAEAKEKQIKLDDIERDTLAAEKRAKQQLTGPYLPKTYFTHPHQAQQPQQPHPTGAPTPPKMQYGFVPLKTPPHLQSYNQGGPQYQIQYQQQQQPQQVVQQEYQYVSPAHPQAYIQQSPRANNQHRVQYQQPSHQVAEPQERPRYTQTQTHTQSSYIPGTIQAQAFQQYLQQSHAQGHPQTQTQIQYIPESQLHYAQIQQHIQPQVQYIVDNSIQQQQPTEQKYYQQTPQYVYIQPYQTPAASNSIQSISDTKGNVQYVMYVPAAAAFPTETVLAYPTSQETQYVYQSNEPEAPKAGVKYAQQVSYVEEKPTYQQQQRPVFKQQPTSLLDSYVPSYLQYQYYKQQQQHDSSNAIKPQSVKLTSGTDIGKADLVKSTSKSAPTSAYTLQQRSAY